LTLFSYFFSFFAFCCLGFFTFFLPLVPIALSSYFENLFLISYFLIKRYTTCKPIATASPRITQAKSLLPSQKSSLIAIIITIVRETHNRPFILFLLFILLLFGLLHILSSLSSHCFVRPINCYSLARSINRLLQPNTEKTQ